MPATSTRSQDNRTIPASVVDELDGAARTSSRRTATVQIQGVYVIGSDGKLVGGNGPPGLRAQLQRA